MSVEVRPCSSTEELREALSPIWHFFGGGPTDESAARFSHVLPPERMLAARLDGQVVGGGGAFPFELTVPGGRVRAGGVTVVGVLPTHRRRGILRALMRAQLDDLHERGEPVAYLWASEATIYGRFGYGLAALDGQLEIDRQRGAFAEPFEPRGAVRLLTPEESLERIPPVYERVAHQTPGMFARTPAWWEHRALADPEWRRGGGGEMQRVVLELDGRDAGYGLYRVHTSFEYGSSTGHTGVLEAMGDSPEATRELWRYLIDVDWMATVKAWLLPVDHELLLLLAEPRRARFTVADSLWLRLVDVDAALSARTFQDGGQVVVDVRDAFCPWNEGRWLIASGGTERTDEEPDLALDVSALGSAYLGGFTFADLRRAGRVEELREGAIQRADALFRTERKPWCPEIF
jgi:predicted acetyltransferase